MTDDNQGQWGIFFCKLNVNANVPYTDILNNDNEVIF